MNSAKNREGQAMDNSKPASRRRRRRAHTPGRPPAAHACALRRPAQLHRLQDLHGAVSDMTAIATHGSGATFGADHAQHVQHGIQLWTACNMGFGSKQLDDGGLEITCLLQVNPELADFVMMQCVVNNQCIAATGSIPGGSSKM